MRESDLTFGKIILEARKKKGYTLRACAALILKEDRSPISFPYLNDVENGRRLPSEHIIKQIALILDLPVEYLYVYAEMFPKGIKINADQDKIVSAFRTFVKSLG